MSITFVGSSAAYNASGLANASIPAHAAGDYILLFNLSTGGYPSPPAGWSLIREALYYYGSDYAQLCYRIATSSGTVNSGWSNVVHQSIAVYRGIKYHNSHNVSIAQGASYGLDVPSNSGFPASRASANLVVAFASINGPDAQWLALANTFQRYYSSPPVTSRLASDSVGQYAFRIVDHSSFTNSSGFRSTSFAANSRISAAAYIELLDAAVALTADVGSHDLYGGNAAFSLSRTAETASFGSAAGQALFDVSAVAESSVFATDYGQILVHLSTAPPSGIFSLSGGNAALNAYRTAASGIYSLTSFDVSLRFNAPVAHGAFLCTAPDAQLPVRKDNYQALAATAGAGTPTVYGGSDHAAPSFLRPYYVQYNAVTKAKDLGRTEILIADVEGVVGGHSGTNTIYLKIELARDLELRVRKRPTGAATDRLIRVGVLDADRRPVQVNEDGYAFLNDIHNTDVDESYARLPAGGYYVTIACDQWQPLPYAITVYAGRYALLSGLAGGSLAPSGRFPLTKLAGSGLALLPASATLVRPGAIKNLSASTAPTGSAPATLVTLAILRGVALGRNLASARLMMNWRLSGVASGLNSSAATLTRTASGGGGYGY